MRSRRLVERNLKEVWRDPLSLGLNLVLPVAMLLVLSLLADVEEYFTATLLTPGIVLFGFVMLMLSTAMTLARDRESALFARLLTTPLGPNAFVGAYSLPYVPVAVLQAALLYGIGWALGLEIAGNALLVVLVLLVMALFYIALGMVLGALLSYKAVPALYAPILILTIFGGAWMDPAVFGGVLAAVAEALPFAHALDAVRDVMTTAASLGDIAEDLAWVVGYTVVTATAAVLVFRRGMVESAT